MSRPKLLLPPAYVEQATKHINTATNYVSFLCMMVTDDTATDKLIDALVAAAKRGVDVRVAADTFTYGELGGHFIPLKYYTKKSRSTTKMARELTRAGAKFTWLGRFSTLPFTGRTHSKCLIVDDTVYSFGGVNLYDESIGYIDYMFNYDDKELAAGLREQIDRLIVADRSNFAYRSHTFESSIGTVLVDGGFQGDSVIYRRAVQLAREAKEVLFVSQYCPAGRLNRALKDTNSRIYFNMPRNASFWNRIIIRLNMALSGQKTLYKKHRYLHAKFMVFTMPDGKKIAITGSHNFVPGGVIFGTRELALETSEPSIIRQLEKFSKDHIQ